MSIDVTYEQFVKRYLVGEEVKCQIKVPKEIQKVICEYYEYDSSEEIQIYKQWDRNIQRLLRKHDRDIQKLKKKEVQLCRELTNEAKKRKEESVRMIAKDIYKVHQTLNENYKEKHLTKSFLMRVSQNLTHKFYPKTTIIIIIKTG